MVANAESEAAKRRRMPADARRAEMLAAAAEYLADHGFAATTRDLAAALGITQALIYKHFASKDALIEAVLDRAFAAATEGGPWIDAAAPVGAELSRYYRGMVADADPLRTRLFIRAGLDGRSLPARRGHALTRNLFLPAIAGLRREAGLPGFDAVPAMRGERELMMSLHAAIVFLGIRRFIYNMAMPENLDDVVGLYVTGFMAGAVPAIQALHKDGEASLTVPLKP